MSTQTYTVEGMTCGACIAEVIEGIRTLPGVSGVSVGFARGTASPMFIESPSEIAPAALNKTLEAAGFHVSGTTKRHARRLQRTFTGNLPSDVAASSRRGGRRSSSTRQGHAWPVRVGV